MGLPDEFWQINFLSIIAYQSEVKSVTVFLQLATSSSKNDENTLCVKGTRDCYTLYEKSIFASIIQRNPGTSGEFKSLNLVHGWTTKMK